MTRTRESEAGFTLVEVVVAVVLVVLVFLSVSVFFVRGIQSATTLQRASAGVHVADQAMDFVRSVPAYDSSGRTRLLANRSQSAVQAQWAAATAPAAELSTTTAEWDTAGATVPAVDTTCFRKDAPAPGSDQPLVPLRATCDLGGTTYTVDTFIGSCVQTLGTSACTNASGTAGAPAYRVVVRVGWRNEGTDTSCAGTACHYLLTTIIDAEADLVFHSFGQPLPAASQDVAVLAHGRPVGPAGARS